MLKIIDFFVTTLLLVAGGVAFSHIVYGGFFLPETEVTETFVTTTSVVTLTWAFLAGIKLFIEELK